MSNQKDPKDFLYEGERLDDLQRDGMYIIQNPKWFCFGMDAVLLSAYAKVKEGEKCLDLGCGNGIIPLLLSRRTKGSSFTGLELQKDIAEMAKRSVAYNEKEDKVHIVQGDIREATSIFEAASFDVVTSNPPYLNQSNGRVSEASHKAIARHELFCTFEDVVKAAAKLLRPGGRFYLVHRPFRLAEIISCMVQYKLEPKRMRLVYPYVDKEPNMALIEGVRGGNRQLTVEKPLIAYEDTNQYTEEVRRMYYD
jgi:tRNA1Val (adenine37-N6)-methyltransferase